MPELPLHLTELFTVYQVGGGIFLLIAVIAELFLRWNEGRSVVPKDGYTNLSLFMLGPIMEGVFANALLLAGLFFIYDITPLRVPIELWTIPIYFLVGELAQYWFHRVGHEARIFWSDHSIHHSSQEYDFTTNLRHTPFSTVYRLLTWSVPVALGFNPVLTVLMAMVAPSFQLFCHTQRLGKMPAWFEWLFVTPRNHAVHHACNPEYIDKNYGGLLMLWDHVFGTYQALRDDVPPVYGITRQVNSQNPLKVLVWEYKFLLRDFWHAPTLRQKLGVLFGKPGHTFEVTKERPAEPNPVAVAAE